MNNHPEISSPNTALEYPVHPLIATRKSGRAFSEKPVDAPTLHSLFEAARWAASASNEQPWNFLVATKDSREGFDRILHCLVEFNRHWAQQAPVLILLSARLTFASTGKPNSHALYDAGQAAANFALQATAHGLIAHQMAGFDRHKAREEFGISEDQEPIAVIAAGYPGDPESLPEKLKLRELAPRTRKPQEQFVKFLG